MTGDDQIDDEWVFLDPLRRPPDPVAVGSIVDRVVRAMGAPGTDAVELVFNRWEEVVGAVLARRTRPVSIDEGTLTLQADDPAVVSHVQWLEHDLLAKLDELLGEGRVRAVVVRVTPARDRARRRSRG